MVEVRLRAVRVDLQSNTPVLLLQESEGLGRTLPIFIGAPEATAIAFALQGMDTPRPMTHDLIRDLLDALGADVVRVVITELKTATYFAEIVLRHGDREVPVSSRPSDAVAVAVRTGAPLFVADDLMDSEGIMLAVDEDDDEDDDDEDEECQSRRAGRRVPQVPRLHPPGGLLFLSAPDPGRRPSRSVGIPRDRPGRRISSNHGTTGALERRRADVKRRSGFVLVLAVVGGCAMAACSSSPTTSSTTSSTSRPAPTTSSTTASSTTASPTTLIHLGGDGPLCRRPP